MTNTLTIPAKMPAAPQTEQFQREFVAGDTGDDVAKTQAMLQAFGMSIDEEELKDKKYGKSTEDAARNFIQQSTGNPILEMFANFFCQMFFHMSASEFLNPETSLGVPRANRNSHEPSPAEVGAIRAVWGDTKGIAGVATLAERYVGIRETGDNCGAAVQEFCGQVGAPWCGGFAHYVFEHSVPGVYDQKDFMLAKSFQREAAQYGAFRSPHGGYTPRVGDAVVFDRGGDKGHVGVVSSIENGKVIYVAGNDGDSVRERSFDINSPPRSFLGYSDTQTLAHAKGINLEKGQDAQLIATSTISTANRGPVAAHSDSAVRGG